MGEADLRGANLTGANLTGANLSSANLQRATIVGTNFKGTDLLETKLKKTDLSQALNLGPEEVDQAFIDEKTRVPDYLEVTWIDDDVFECKARPSQEA